MNTWQKIVFLVLMNWMLTGCATLSPKCEFIYTDQIQEELVLPLIKKVIGEEAYKYYDYDSPTILYERKNEVWLWMIPTKAINGYTLTSEDSFVIVLEECTEKYITYFTQKMN